MTEKDKTGKGEQDRVIKGKITISSTDFDAIQSVTNSLLKNKEDHQIDLKGPTKVPNKRLKIACRKTPNGQGTKTFDKWEMTVYKRYFKLNCSEQKIKKLTDIQLPKNLKFELASEVDK